jgi:predicted dehydrogenase
MNTAMIGCGFIANIHAQAIHGLGHTISIAVDHNANQAKAFAEQYGIYKWSTDFHDALVNGIDCIHICTPPALHYEMIKKALLAGKHVICEKPLVLENEQADGIVQLAQQNNLVHAVNFNVRFYNACQIAKKMIQSADFGKTLIIHGSYQQEFHIPPADVSWRYQTALAGPMRAVTEIGSHWIDLARYLTGLEITQVSTNFTNFNPSRILQDGKLFKAEASSENLINITSEDAAVISLRFSNGSIGSVLLSEVSHGRTNALSIEVVGEKQSVWWQSENPNELTQASKGEGIKIQKYPFSGAYPETFTHFFKNVYQAIESSSMDMVNFPTFIDGRFNTNVCNAIFESAHQNGSWVSVPVDFGG